MAGIFGNGNVDQGMKNLSVFGQDINQMMKALYAGDDIVVGGTTGGPALRLQNIDRVLQLTTWDDTDLKVQKVISNEQSKGPVEEWSVLSEYGSPYGVAVNEGVNPTFTDPNLTRLYGQAKYYESAREITLQEYLSPNMMDARELQEMAGARQIAGARERDLFFGDPTKCPAEFIGLRPWIESVGDPAQIVDMHGGYFSDQGALQAAASVIINRAGKATHMFYDPQSQADINNLYASAFRFQPAAVSANGRVRVGGVPNELEVAGGPMMLDYDLFLGPNRGFINPATPNDVINIAPTAARGGDSDNPAPAAPTSVTAGTITGSDANGTNLPTGEYYYGVASYNGMGESAAVFVGPLTVTAGQHVPLTIEATDPSITSYRIYRSAVNAADNTNCRYQNRVAATTGATLLAPGTFTGTITWTDYGADIPGTTCAFMGEFSPRGVQPALGWRQWGPMAKFELAYVKTSYRWIQMLWGYLRVSKPRRFVMFKNILPSGLFAEGWNPLGVVAQ